MSSLLDKVDHAIDLVDKQKFEQKQNNDDAARILSCYGADELNALLNKIKSERIFLLFCGNLVNGQSWCPDCVAAKPVIEANLKYLNKDTDTFITVYVGEKADWKDKKNIFRTDARFKLTGVPTLMLYNQPEKRLVEAQIKDDLVQMLFEEDDS